MAAEEAELQRQEEEKAELQEEEERWQQKKQNYKDKKKKRLAAEEAELQRQEEERSAAEEAELQRQEEDKLQRQEEDNILKHKKIFAEIIKCQRIFKNNIVKENSINECLRNSNHIKIILNKAQKQTELQNMKLRRIYRRNKDRVKNILYR